MESKIKTKKQNPIKKIWEFLKKDTWQSWIVSIILLFILIKFILFPTLTFITGSPLPLVVVESCSMYHESSFDDWWGKNAAWYGSRNISLSDFSSFSFNGGLNKGDIVLVISKKNYDVGDIIIFKAQTVHPLIHRLISLSPLATKGDHNPDQLSIEKEIEDNAILGKAAIKIPLLGWLKLIFYDFSNPPSQRGFCK